jgi:hypothetical protein
MAQGGFLSDRHMGGLGGNVPIKNGRILAATAGE